MNLLQIKAFSCDLAPSDKLNSYKVLHYKKHILLCEDHKLKYRIYVRLSELMTASDGFTILLSVSLTFVILILLTWCEVKKQYTQGYSVCEPTKSYCRQIEKCYVLLL